MDTRGGTEADEKTRISKARAAFHILRHVWKSRVIGKTTKIRLFNTNVKSVLLNGTDMHMAIAQHHTENDPDFCKSVLVENIGNDGPSQQQGPLGGREPAK